MKNFQFIVLALLLVTACNRTPKNNLHTDNLFLLPDSLFTPTGDAELDSLLLS